jgi:signal transduction histidine kinase
MRPKFGSSLLLKILGALFLVLAASSAATIAIEGHLTRAQLSKQSRRLVAEDLHILRAAYSQREAVLVGSLRDLAQSLSRANLPTARRSDLIEQLGRVQRNLGLDTLEIFDRSGSPIAAVGTPLAPTASLLHGTGDSTGKLLRAASGATVQAAIFRVSGDARVAGGYLFGDALAYQLRSQVGNDVLLVADDRIVGSTLSDPPDEPPLLEAGKPPPQTVSKVRLSGHDRLLQYATVGEDTGGARGALGVVVDDPVAALDTSLTRTRVLVIGVLAAVALALAWLLFRALTRPLVVLTRTAGRIERGELDAPFVSSTKDDIGILAHSLERMRVELLSKLDVIREQAIAIRDSSKRIAAATDEERHRIARDIHDVIQQPLVVMRMNVGMAKDKTVDPTASTLLEGIGSELDDVIASLREVSHNLFPSVLSDRGLTLALRSFAGRLPLSTRLTSDPDPLPRLPPEIESTAYFLLSEAVANALKHAQARELVIALHVQNGHLNVSVFDDGKGFEPGTTSTGRGLQHMADRVRSFGGELTIAAGPGEGTEIRAILPIRKAGEEPQSYSTLR